MEKVLVVILVFSHQTIFTSSQILGAGSGEGSCRAAPFRSNNVNWDVCPPSTPCCSEYGYCRTREEWKQLKFRDCNGVSNGIDLPLSVLILEEQLRRGANSPGLNPEDNLTNQNQNSLQNQNNRFNQNQNNANSQNRFANQNQNNAFDQNNFSNQNQFNQAQNNGFQNQQSNRQNQQNSLRKQQNGLQNQQGNQNNQNLNNFLSNPNSPFPGQLPNNPVFAGTSSSSGSSSSSSSASSSSSSNSESSSFGFVPNNPVFGQSSSSSSSASSSSAASAANNFQNQNTFQIVGSPGGGGVGVLAGVVTGVTGGGATGISEGQAVSISLINQTSGSGGTQGSKKKKKKKNPFGFGNRVTTKPKKPNNINQILENIFEEDKPPKRKIVIRPQNSNKKTPEKNQKGKLTVETDEGSPLVGYQNTGGYPMDLDGVNCPNYPFCWWNPYKRNN